MSSIDLLPLPAPGKPPGTISSRAHALVARSRAASRLRRCRVLFTRVCAALALWQLASCWPRVAAAEEVTPGETERALPGFIRVASPTPSLAKLVIATGLSYGFLDSTLDLPSSGHRAQGTLSTAITPLPFLSLAADVSGHWDIFPNASDGGEANLYGEPRLSARFFRPAWQHGFWGAEADVRFIGAEAPSIHWASTSPSLRGLLGSRVADGTWIGAQLGFHLDRSAAAIPDARLIAAEDKRTLNASSWNAIQWGVGASHRLAQIGTELIAEVSGETLVGDAAPSFLEAPLLVGVAARQPLSRAFALAFRVELAASARPDTLTAEQLLPMAPRFTSGLVLSWRLLVPQPTQTSTSRPAVASPAKAVAAPTTAAPAVALPPSVPVTGTVVDEGGRPLADAKVSLFAEGRATEEVRTAANGGFEFQNVPKGRVELLVTTPGFDTAKIEIADDGPRTREVVLYPAVPAGQVQGQVRDLQGAPLQAKVTIIPGNKLVEAQADGSFELELPPGSYTVRVEHPNFTPQKRTFRVEDRGVVILNIALTR